MLCASHMRAAGQKQGRSCSRRPSLHAAAVSEDLWSACLSPNLRTIKTRCPLHRFPFAFNWIDCVLITSCNSEFKIKPSTSSCVRGGGYLTAMSQPLPVAPRRLNSLRTSCCTDLCVWHLCARASGKHSSFFLPQSIMQESR